MLLNLLLRFEITNDTDIKIPGRKGINTLNIGNGLSNKKGSKYKAITLE